MIRNWIKIAKVLSLEIIAPFEYIANNGKILVCDVFLKGFGHSKGMLINSNSNVLDGFWEEVSESGYGFTSYCADQEMEIDIQNYIEMLREWDWTGAEKERPNWF